jgi:predicted HTH transcriptional regulator
MDIDILREQISHGEDSSRQFKVDVKNSESIASEMAAFANSEGGTSTFKNSFQ